MPLPVMAGAASSSASSSSVVPPVRRRKALTEEQRKAENSKRRIANETPEMKAKREAQNAERRGGGSLFKIQTPDERKMKNRRQFNTRHAAKPEMRTNAPRRKFQNRNPECLSRTNVDEVFELRYNAIQHAEEIGAAIPRAEEAEAKVALLEEFVVYAEARDKRRRTFIGQAKARARIRQKKRAGVEPSIWDKHMLQARKSKIARTEEALCRESKARAAAEAKLAKHEAKLAEHRKENAKLKAWFEETDLSELLGQRDRMPTKAEVESDFVRQGAAEASDPEASD